MILGFRDEVRRNVARLAATVALLPALLPLLLILALQLPVLGAEDLAAGGTPAPGGLYQKLVDGPRTLHDIAEGQTARVVVNLTTPMTVLADTDFASPTSVRALQTRVSKAQQQVLDATLGNDVRLRFRFDNIAAFSAEVTAKGLAALQNHPAVVSIEPVFILEAHLAQGIPLMHGTTYRSSYNGAGMAIAICDTGIDYNHARLGGGGFPNSKVLGGYDFGDSDSNPIPNGQAHGTCCAGIAAGDLGTVGDYIGGVAYGAKLYALKISYGSTGSAYSDAMVAAWDWCVSHRDDNPSYPIKVISTSFGGGRFYSTAQGDSYVPSMTTAASNAVAAGITVLASSGNDGYCDSMGWPAAISSVISVGAVYDASFGTYYPCVNAGSCAPKTHTGGCSTHYYATDITAPDKVTSYSNVASFLTLFAPSNKCYTLDIAGSTGYSTGDYYDSFGGTSAACPYAAGAVACLQSAAVARIGRFLTAQEVRDWLTSSGDPVTDTKVAITKPRVNLESAIGCLPVAPTDGVPTADSTTAITWKWSDVAGETGYRVKDTGGAQKSPDLPADTVQWQETTGLSANTQYTRKIYAFSGCGESGGSTGQTRWTLSVAPTAGSVTPSDSTPCVNTQVSWTAVGGFGVGTVQYYRYAWDQTATHTWTGSETQWSSGTIATTPTASGTWYLHIKGYNGEDVANGTCDYSVTTDPVPYVTDVTSDKPNGAYGLGEQIDIDVMFSEIVFVTGGSPALELETGAVDRKATYLSGDGTNTLTFRYTVQSGDASGDLDCTSANALTLEGGTIRDTAGNDADLTLPQPGAEHSLGFNKDIVIQTCLPPTITEQPVDQFKCAGDYGAIFYVGAAGTEPLSYQWYKNAEIIPGANSASYTIWSVSLDDAGLYHCEITDVCGLAASNAATLTVLPAPIPVAEAKQQADNAAVTLAGKVVTYAEQDFFYVEEGSRVCGIRVEKASHGLGVGARVDVSGTMRTSADGERYLDATYVSQGGTGTVAPLAVSNRGLGGGDYFHDPGTGAGQQGISGANGLNNIGLLVTATGRVTYVGADSFYIDDGAGLDAGSGRTGVRVLAIGLTLPGEGDYVRVTGVSSCFKSEGALYRLIRARGDLMALTGAPCVAPTISEHPTGLIRTAGQSATFTVVANGTGPMSYQRRKDGSPIPCATGSSYLASLSNSKIANLKTSVDFTSEASLDRSAGASDLSNLVLGNYSYKAISGTEASVGLSPFGMGKNRGSVGLTLKHPLGKGRGKLSEKYEAIRSAKSAVSVQDKQLFLQKQNTVYRVTSSYFRAVQAREQIKVQEKAGG